MNIIDIAIIGFLLFGALLGFKRGFTKQLLSFLGLIAVVVLAFYLKNYVSVFMYENLPFIPFGGVFKGITVLNIAIYEVIAFFLVLAVLGIVLKVLLMISGIFETVLNATIILGIPSKILGMVVGVLEAYVMVFIVLYILSLPVFNFTYMEGSKAKDPILKSTPVLSGLIDKSIGVIEEFAVLKEKYDDSTSVDAFNLETLDIFLKHNVITVESVDKLVEKNKLQIDNIESVIKKYR